MTTRLAIVSTHPIQYNAPAFASLARDPGLEVRAYYEWEGPGRTLDREFGRAVAWDIPLLSGYDHTFVRNVSRDPGSHRFRGIDNPSLVAEITSWKPDVLLIHGWSFASHLRVLRELHGRVPIVFRGDSTLADEKGGARTVARRALLRWVYRHIDVALYAGTLNRSYYRAHGVSDDQLVWAPHAIDNEHFSANAAARESQARAWRTRLGIGDDETVFLFAGKLVRRKDPATLLEAFTRLRSRVHMPTAHLVFVGDGELAASLQATVPNRSDVHFLGFQNQTVMPTAYRIGDVLVLPSVDGETWGLAVNEAMACARPAIVSDRVGCGPDLVRPGGTGLVFKHGDPQSLFAAMSALVGDRKRAAVMGREALSLIDAWSIQAYTAVVSRVAKNIHVPRAASPFFAT